MTATIVTMVNFLATMQANMEAVILQMEATEQNLSDNQNYYRNLNRYGGRFQERGHRGREQGRNAMSDCGGGHDQDTRCGRLYYHTHVNYGHRSSTYETPGPKRKNETIFDIMMNGSVSNCND